MSKYIRKEDASDWLKQYGQDVLHGKYKFSLMYIWKNIMDLPPADVAPVVHARWILRKTDCNRYRECSACNVWLLWNMPRNSYCPNCGAKMDGEE